jgi:hypothetical protein
MSSDPFVYLGVVQEWYLDTREPIFEVCGRLCLQALASGCSCLVTEQVFGSTVLRSRNDCVDVR